MERRDIGYAIAYILSFVFMATIGISFSVFKDQKQRVEVKSITVSSEEGIIIKAANKTGDVFALDVHSPKVGTKPASGELDTQTDIPFTVNDQVGSEGAYAKFEIESDSGCKIILQNVKGVPESELDNVKISVTGTENKPFSAKDIGKTLFQANDVLKNKKFTVLVWLDQHTSNKIVGSKIEIELSVVH